MFQQILILLYLVSIQAVTQFKVSSCGSATDLMQKLVLSVSPVLPQTDYTLYLDGILNANITGGTSDYTITYNFIPLTPSTNDLCTEINKSNITCPLSLGLFASESKGTITSGLSGSVTIKNQWFNENKERILCMLFNIKI